MYIYIYSIYIYKYLEPVCLYFGVCTLEKKAQTPFKTMIIWVPGTYIFIYIYTYSPTKKYIHASWTGICTQRPQVKVQVAWVGMGSRPWVHAVRSVVSLFSPRYMIKLERVYPREV